jgi:putative tricarboxylic transport membrane protein
VRSPGEARAAVPPAAPDDAAVTGRAPAFPIRYLGSLITLGIGVLGVVLSARLGIGSLRQPEPGLWPLIVSIGVCTFSVASLVDDTQDAEPESLPLGRLLAGVAGLAIFILGFQHLGLVLPTVVTLVLWLRLLARESWRTTVLIASVATALLWLLFARLLGVPFPPDVLGI